MFCFGLSKDLQTSLLPMMGEGFRVSRVPGVHMSGCPVVRVFGCLGVWRDSFNGQKVRSISVQFSRYILVIKTNICEVS